MVLSGVDWYQVEDRLSTVTYVLFQVLRNVLFLLTVLTKSRVKDRTEGVPMRKRKHDIRTVLPGTSGKQGDGETKKGMWKRTVLTTKKTDVDRLGLLRGSNSSPKQKRIF